MFDSKEVEDWLNGIGSLPKRMYDPNGPELEVHCFGYKRKKNKIEEEKTKMDTLDELYEKAIKGELKPVETKANIFETLEEPKTATELSNNSFITSKNYTRNQIIDIVNDEFNKLIEGFEELNLTSDELYLIEKAKANIAIRLCGIDFAEKVYVPIYKPVGPYGPIYPWVTNPTIDWTYTTDKTTMRPNKEM